MMLAVVGLSHATAPIEVREHLTFPVSQQAGPLRELTALPDIEGGLIVSTCNRTEVYVTATIGARSVETVAAWLARSRGLSLEDLRPYLYAETGDGAVDHLFRVVSSLESLVLGEAQILGQVRTAYQSSCDAGTCDAYLDHVLRQALEVGKRVRSETGVGESTVSLSTVAVDLAKRVFERLDGRTVLVVGAGEMGELTARYLVESGADSVLVLNRTDATAIEVADRIGGKAVPFDTLYAHMAIADIVISSTAAPGYVIERDRVARARQANRAARGRSCLMIDIALPRDIEPGVDAIDDVYVYDLDDLNSIIDAHREDRRSQAVVAEGIVAEEVDAFRLWQQTQQVVPTIKGIHAKGARIAEREVAHAVRALGGVSDEEHKVLEAMAASIVTKVLHGPTVRLRKYAGEPDAYRYTEAARFLFGLESNPDGVSRHGRATGVDRAQATGSEAADEASGDGGVCSRCTGLENPLCSSAGSSVCRYATAAARAAIAEMGPACANVRGSQRDTVVTRKGHHA